MAAACYLAVFILLAYCSQGCSAVTGGFIINGATARLGEFPHMAFLRKSGSFVCGGSLIAPHAVLTASHCVFASSASQFTVTLGEHNHQTTEGWEQTFRVTRIIRHYSSPQVDLAVLILDRQAIQNFAVRVVKLHDRAPQVGSRVTATGWGWMLSANPASISTTLQKLELPVASYSKCVGDGVSLNIGYEFCAGSEQPSYTNVCHGDSGGPAVQKLSSSEYIQVGVVVRGIQNCPTDKDYAVFVALTSSIKRWVLDTANANVFVADRTSTTTRRPSTRQKKSSCFAPDSQVETPIGPRLISELSVGDLVKSFNAEHSTVWTPVIGSAHSDAHKTTSFLHVYTQDTKRPMKITDKHLIFTEVLGERTAVFADQLQIGQTLYIKKNEQMLRSNITAITHHTSQGAYAPITEEGTIIVDGVLASCYAHVDSHRVCHAALSPLRWWRYLSGMQLGWYTPLLQHIFSSPLAYAGLYSI